MKIGVDCRLAGTRHAGIGRYIENLVQRLPIQASNVEWVFFFSDTKQVAEVFGTTKRPTNIRVVLTPIRHYTIAEQLLLPIYFYREKLDVLHVPHFNVPILYVKKTVITIHDLLWHQHKGSSVTTLSPLVYWSKYYFYLIVTWFAIQKATLVFVPAKTVKTTVSNLFPNATKKIRVTKEGVTTPIIQDAVSAPKNPYLLFVGSLYPHKNVALVVEALQQLPKMTLKLVGSRSIFQNTIMQAAQNYNVSNQIEYLGYQSDEDLALLYTQAAALVQPSFSEGFGLTGLEAMALGTPVLASHIPVFTEIYQNGALFFDPHSIASFVQAVHTLEDKELCATLKKNAQLVVSQYSWDTMTEEMDIKKHSNHEACDSRGSFNCTCV